MNPRKRNPILALAIAACLTVSATAIPLEGTLEYNLDTSAFSFDNNSVTFVGAFNGKVNDATGHLAFLLNSNITHWDFTYAPFVGPIDPLMTVAPFSFALTSITYSDFNTSGDTSLLNLVGTGIGTIPGFDPTLFHWSFVATESPNVSNYSAILSTWEITNVPDSGATLSLLGLSLMGILAVARFRSRRAAS